MRRIPLFLSVPLVFGMLFTAAFRSGPNSALAGPPLQVRMGWVTVYIPGTGIMIQDASGATAAYFLDSSVRILPPPRANTLAIGSHVVILARMDPSTHSWVVFGIVVLPPSAGPVPPPPTPTFVPSSTPTLVPSETPTITPTMLPTDTPTSTPTVVPNTPTDTPTNTPTVVPNTPTDTPTNTPTATPTDTPTNTPTETPTP